MRLHTLACVLFIPLLVLGQGPSKMERKVRAQLDRNKPYPAIRNASAMLAKGGHPEFFALRARGYNSIGEFAQAGADAHRALEASPGSVEGLFQLAIAEQGLGRLDSAAIHLRQLLAGSPDVEVCYRLATVEQMRGHLGQAMAEVDQALLAQGPVQEGAARLHRLKGEIAAMAGDTAMARTELDRAVALAPKDPVNYNSRGFYGHAWRGDHQAAIADYDRAIKLNPNYSYAFNNRGWSLYRLGQTEKGLKDIGKARRKKAHNPYVYRNLGVIALEAGDTAKACVLFRQALDEGFTALYGNEVEGRVAASCGRVPTQAPASNMPDRPAEKAAPRTNAPE
ncbi:MAG: tetratricopeptide repeat protein [Flavobacteriales bacterium]|nr:tetratricopeptide repeat protein [Flavobacteriales bacterium]MEB2342861.1 tetratricopeptide repeat protein [Flavobacteriia bacterium]